MQSFTSTSTSSFGHCSGVAVATAPTLGVDARSTPKLCVELAPRHVEIFLHSTDPRPLLRVVDVATRFSGGGHLEVIISVAPRRVLPAAALLAAQDRQCLSLQRAAVAQTLNTPATLQLIFLCTLSAAG